MVNSLENLDKVLRDEFHVGMIYNIISYKALLLLVRCHLIYTGV